MKIGVVSDSHGNLSLLERAIEQMGDVDVIFHLGDYVDDGEQVRKKKSIIPVYTLRGNMDYNTMLGTDFVKTVIDGKTIIACHGHAYGVKRDINTYFYKAKSEKADIALFGHTHRAFLEESEGVLLMNPGALSYSYMDYSFGVLTIENNHVSGEIIPIQLD